MLKRMVAGMMAAAAMACAAGGAAAQVVVFERGGEMLTPVPFLTGSEPLDGTEETAWVKALGASEPFVVDPLHGPFVGWNGVPEPRTVAHYRVGVNAGVLPEPAVWGMMLVGFFGAGFLLRRYKHEMMAAWPEKA